MKSSTLITACPCKHLKEYLFLHHLFVFPAWQQALHLLKEMDQDGDGQISQAEVLKNQDTFLNSEVTDYGRQLHISHDEL